MQRVVDAVLALLDLDFSRPADSDDRDAAFLFSGLLPSYYREAYDGQCRK
jgi:hypothetical protein